ncbi:MAG: radical SAM protein, partial [Anaerovoracaceae bacterium]
KISSPSITISVGEVPYNTLKSWYDAGGDRYLLRFETSDEKQYRELHPCGTLDERLNCLKDIKKIGYETGGGFMVGLPGETIEILADNILLLKELDCDMAGIGPYIETPGTKLYDLIKENGKENNESIVNGETRYAENNISKNEAEKVQLTKRSLALARILEPRLNLPVTTAVGVLDIVERNKAFSEGANVIMKKVTPDKYKEKYQIYPADFQRTDIKKDRLDLERFLKEIGRNPV